MARKQKKTSNDVKQALQDKIDKVKLESHIAAVEHNKPIDVIGKISSDSSLITSSFKSTIAWAKKNNLGKQAKQLMDTVTDGIVLFLSNLTKKSKE